MPFSNGPNLLIFYIFIFLCLFFIHISTLLFNFTLVVVIFLTRHVYSFPAGLFCFSSSVIFFFTFLLRFLSSLWSLADASHGRVFLFILYHLSSLSSFHMLFSFLFFYCLSRFPRFLFFLLAVIIFLVTFFRSFHSFSGLIVAFIFLLLRYIMFPFVYYFVLLITFSCFLFILLHLLGRHHHHRCFFPPSSSHDVLPHICVS